jgi:1-acyl-sn-glycerol-3-phosphate acyltransferase
VLFVPRSGSKEQLTDILQSVNVRTQMNEEGKGDFPATVIFPEGTCSNNHCIMRFRKGAFSTLRQVRPVTIKYRFQDLSPAIEAIDEPMVVFLGACVLQTTTAEMTILPPFQPNEFLFENHKDKAEEKWEIYAWAVRDVMAKVGGFAKHDIKFAERIQVYKYLMQGAESWTLSEEQKQKIYNKKTD